MVLVGNLRVLHETADNTACGTKEGPVSVLYLVGVGFCIEDVSFLDSHSRKLFMPHLTGLLNMYCLTAQAVLGGNHALFEAELLAGALEVLKEK